jgi:hypothetical protein
MYLFIVPLGRTELAMNLQQDLFKEMEERSSHPYTFPSRIDPLVVISTPAGNSVSNKRWRKYW